MVELNFTSENLEPVEFKPSWTKEKHFSESSCQCDPINKTEMGVQSIESSGADTQTDAPTNEKMKFAEDNSPALVEFLKRVTPSISIQLDKNVRSHAFDGYEVNWGSGPVASQTIFSLSNTVVGGKLQVTSLSWSSTGSVLAIAYGNHDHSNWCTDRSFLCTWNVDKRNVDTFKPDIVIDIECCLMELAFHPKQQNIIAGGTFNGEIRVWDLSREDDMLVASCGMVENHREPITKLVWFPDEKTMHSGKAVYNIMSCSPDGKMLIWKVSSRGDKNLELLKGFCILAESLPDRSLRTKRDAEIGVTCVSFVFDDPSTFIVATEPGCLFKCNTDFQGTLAPKSMQSKMPLYSPVSFTYNQHSGTVYTVHCSPFHRKLFLSASADMSIRLYNILEKNPLMSIEPNVGFIFSAQFSPIRPLVFAAVSSMGTLLVYDLKANRAAPAHRVDTKKSKKALYSVKFNREQHRLLSIGDADGVAQVIQLSEEFASAWPEEHDLLAALINESSGE